MTVAIIIDEAIFESLSPQGIVALFPEDFHKNLKQLVATVISKNMPRWKESTSSNQISLPRLTALDWRIDVKTSSDTFARIAVPSVIVDLQVRFLFLFPFFFYFPSKFKFAVHLVFARFKKTRSTRM